MASETPEPRARRDRGLETKVGIFVLVGLLLITALVFTLGSERHVFEKQARLYAAFSNVEGLRAGAPVRLAGLDVGLVSGIHFSPRPSDKNLLVEMKVQWAVLARIRKDSIATIGSRGLLGDKVVDLTVGSADEPPVPNGGTLESRPAADLYALVAKADRALENTVSVTESVRRIAASFESSDLQQQAGRLVHTLADLAEAVRGGNGLLHAVVYDPKLAHGAGETLEHVSRSAGALRRTAERAESIVDAIQRGPGLLHASVYSPEGGELIESLEDAAREIEELVRAARTEPGIVHELLYPSGPSNAVADLDRAAADLRAIMDRVRTGEGTVGGLIRDPTVYEDLVETLGEVRRNVLLKAILRFAIKRREAR